MAIHRLICGLALSLAGVVGAAAASEDGHVGCVQRQLQALGLEAGTGDGPEVNDLRRALTRFVARIDAADLRAVFDGLPPFSARSAVGWCRELGRYAPGASALMPSAEPPMILTGDTVPPGMRGHIRRSYGEARAQFAVLYGIETASKPVVIVAFGRDDFERLLRLPVPGIEDISASTARRTADEFCHDVERVRGVAFRNRIGLCMPEGDAAGVTSYAIWRSRYHHVMLHEYMHHVQREMSYDKLPYGPEEDGENPHMGPAWMVEGSAYLAEIKARPEALSRVTVPMLSALRADDSETALPLDRIRKRDLVRSDAEYAASNLAVAALTLRYGEAQMVAFWRAVGETGDWNAAFRAAYGMELEDFEALFEELRKDQRDLIRFARAEAPYEPGASIADLLDRRDPINKVGRRRHARR